jgi:hypothetical protein
MGFEQFLINLIWKWFPNYPKLKEDHLSVINFGMKNFTAVPSRQHHL